jgi:hypothetical protein
MIDYNEICNTKNLFSELLNKIKIKDGELNKVQLTIFFSILKRLKMENGWEPSYQYIKQDMGGEPNVYAINKNGEKDILYNRVITDDTIEGFVQLTFLYLLHDKFCLFWHALYKKIEIIISIKDLLSLPFDDKTLIDLAKIIEIETKINSNFITLNICTFNNWNGLQKIPFLFNLKYPHNPQIIDDEVKIIKKYDNGICY